MDLFNIKCKTLYRDMHTMQIQSTLNKKMTQKSANSYFRRLPSEETRSDPYWYYSHRLSPPGQLVGVNTSYSSIRSCLRGSVCRFGWRIRDWMVLFLLFRVVLCSVPSTRTLHFRSVADVDRSQNTHSALSAQCSLSLLFTDPLLLNDRSRVALQITVG